jgi:hypothetical protein
MTMIGTESKSKLLQTLERAGREREGRERERERENQKQAAEKEETNGPDSKGHGRSWNSGAKSDLCFHGLHRFEGERNKTKQNTPIFCGSS